MIKVYMPPKNITVKSLIIYCFERKNIGTLLWEEAERAISLHAAWVLETCIIIKKLHY